MINLSKKSRAKVLKAFERFEGRLESTIMMAVEDGAKLTCREWAEFIVLMNVEMSRLVRCNAKLLATNGPVPARTPRENVLERAVHRDEDGNYWSGNDFIKICMEIAAESDNEDTEVAYNVVDADLVFGDFADDNVALSHKEISAQREAFLDAMEAEGKFDPDWKADDDDEDEDSFTE